MSYHFNAPPHFPRVARRWLVLVTHALRAGRASEPSPPLSGHIRFIVRCSFLLVCFVVFLPGRSLSSSSFCLCRVQSWSRHLRCPTILTHSFKPACQVRAALLSCDDGAHRFTSAQHYPNPKVCVCGSQGKSGLKLWGRVVRGGFFLEKVSKPLRTTLPQSQSLVLAAAPRHKL